MIHLLYNWIPAVSTFVFLPPSKFYFDVFGDEGPVSGSAQVIEDHLIKSAQGFPPVVERMMPYFGIFF